MSGPQLTSRRVCFVFLLDDCECNDALWPISGETLFGPRAIWLLLVKKHGSRQLTCACHSPAPSGVQLQRTGVQEVARPKRTVDGLRRHICGLLCDLVQRGRRSLERIPLGSSRLEPQILLHDQQASTPACVRSSFMMYADSVCRCKLALVLRTRPHSAVARAAVRLRACGLRNRCRGA